MACCDEYKDLTVNGDFSPLYSERLSATHTHAHTHIKYLKAISAAFTGLI